MAGTEGQRAGELLARATEAQRAAEVAEDQADEPAEDEGVSAAYQHAAECWTDYYAACSGGVLGD